MSNVSFWRVMESSLSTAIIPPFSAPCGSGGDAGRASHGHAAPTEQPWLGRNIGSVPMYFNPRSPDGERPSPPGISPKPERFQSTLPGWGATVEIRTILTQIRYFNPRSPDGERPRNPINTPLFVKFQSTLPGWGATSARSSFGSSQSVFQSTLPGWGATGTNQHVRNLKRFQSTLPGWGATWLVA